MSYKKGGVRAMKLFCIPYSGGSAAAYYKWKNILPKDIQIVAIELAGHGMRINEQCFKNVKSCVEDIAKEIIKHIDDDDYAIWGHSMGAILVYETYYKLLEMGIKAPIHMFFSGRKAPYDMKNRTSYYKLPDKEFEMVVESYGSNVREVMQNETLRSLFMPILRADFELGETYEWYEKPYKIACDITIVNGKEDSSISKINMKDWSNCCGADCTVTYFNGGHFFLFECCEKVGELINKTLDKYRLKEAVTFSRILEV